MKVSIPMRIKHGVLGAILLYILLLATSIFLSTLLVNEAFHVRMATAMHQAKCEQTYQARATNPLKIWDFYAHSDYWLASYRTPVSLINNDACVSLLMKKLASDKDSASVVFIDADGKVALKLHTTR